MDNLLAAILKGVETGNTISFHTDDERGLTVHVKKKNRYVNKGVVNIFSREELHNLKFPDLAIISFLNESAKQLARDANEEN